MRASRLTGRDDFIKARLEEGYSFRLLSRELGVSHETLIKYVKGLGKNRRRKGPGIDFAEPLTTRDFAERHGVTIPTVHRWLHKGRIKGRKIGQRWIIIE